MMPFSLKRLLLNPALVLLVLQIKGPAVSVPAASAPLTDRWRGLELVFEPEADSGSGPARFLARGRNYQFLLSSTELRLALLKLESPPFSAAGGRHHLVAGRTVSGLAVAMQFLNANPLARINGEVAMAGKANYFIGNDPARWRTSVPTFARVRVDELYPGIAVIYYGNQRQLEYDFELAPHADPNAIMLRFSGVDKLNLTEQGELVLKVGNTELHQPPPVIYQIKGAMRVAVQGGYRLEANQTVGFQVGAYDRDLPLIIDPRLEYSSYFGGNGGDLGLEIKADTNGNIYITGETLSTQFPFPVSRNVLQPTFGGGVFNGDAFVAKIDSTGTNLIYLTYLGGNSDDAGYDIAIDNTGNAYITGMTESPNFPTTKNALFPAISGVADPTVGIYPPDGFVTELNTNGSALVFSTYLGGSAFDFADGIAVDPQGNVFVTGFTASTDFPLQNPVPGQTNLAGGIYDAFVTKFAPGGAALVFSTYLGGLGNDEGQGIAVDAKGFAYVTGYTASTNFPITANASQHFLNLTNETSSYDAFLTKFTPAGALAFSTYLGGTYNDFGYRVTLDGEGNPYVTGPAQSIDFPVTTTNVPGLVRTTTQYTNILVNYDVFLTKFTPNGLRAYSIIYGGTNDDVGWDVAVDLHNNAFVVGTTFSGDFPATNVFDLVRATNSGGHDVFITALNGDVSATLYSGYLGGSTNDFGYGIAVDAESSAYIVGNTFSTNFPTTPQHFASTLDGPSDAFIAKIRLQPPQLVETLVSNQLQLQWPASAPSYTLESTPSLTPPTVWTPVGLSPILSQGWYLIDLGATNADAFFRLQAQ